MIKQKTKCFLWLCLMLLGMAQTANAEFRDFSVIVNDKTGTLLTSEEQVQGTAVSFGVAVDQAGTVSRVAANDASAVATVSGNFHSDHGCTGLKVVVPVTGNVKITVGQCTYSTNTITVKNSAGETVVSKTPSSPACWKNSTSNVDELYYSGEATTLTISGMGYCPYVAVEAVQAAPTNYEVTYSLGSESAEGVLPDGATVTAGDTYKIPKNFTLYKEGYTLTGWTDGTNTYTLNQTITPASDLALTPVFTQNTVSLADRTEAVTAKWWFRRDQGAPSVSWQGGSVTYLWVTQVTIGNETIDVPMTIDARSGKFNNTSWTDWCQVNNGTTFTIPSCKDATVSMEAFNDITTTTIDGQDDYTPGKTISYTIANASSTIDIVIGDGTYYRYIQTVLPVVQQSGSGESFNNVSGTVTWALSNEATGTVSNDIADGIKGTSFTKGSGLTDTPKTYLETSMIGYQPETANAGSVEGVMLEYRIEPKAGLTFQPTSISYNAVKDGTDNATYSWSYTLDGVESAITTVSKDDIVRNSNTTGTPPMLHTHNITVNPTSVFTFRIYVSGFGNNKKLGISNVVITGKVNGTIQTVTTYTLTTDATEGGTVAVYPTSSDNTYTEGDVVKLTATPEFGYHFVNWTDGDDNVMSTDAVYNHEMTGDITLTANFQAVETYELALTVDGTNDYMVTVSPEPTMVDGKMMYESGTTVTLTANQYTGLVTFTNWSDGTTGVDNAITMSEDITLTANYAETDIIAGWDFYVAGNNGRPADFASADNQSAALSLVNTSDGTTSGWLDKSTMSGGGYESFKGAAVNWRTGESDGDVGYWHWQTKVNAEAFQNINVQFQMLYNYNAYQTYNAEYSLDGTTWTNFGSINMTGAKAVTSFSQTLPTECNNQANLYIRMIADKNSTVAGTESKNDGNTLAMFFITGTEQLEDDGVAPVLVSTVPANNATGASVSGKVVLTFDEKVKADNAVATLNGENLTATVSGKTVTFAYKDLEYNTQYTFSLPANSIGDLTDNMYAEAITIAFTTKTKDPVTKGLYDAVVSNVDELLTAINNANSRSDKNTRYRIFIKKGTYTIPLYSTKKTCNDYEVQECITFLTGSNVSFIGEDRDEVVITNAIPADATFASTYGTTSKYDGIGNSDVFQISSSTSGLYWQDLTVSTGMEDATGRDIAIQDKGTRNIYKNVKLHGYQDTWTSNNDNGLYYFEGGIVRGRTDYLCGKGDIFFNGVELQQIAGGYAAVPSNPAHVGWVFKDCTINGDGSGVTGNYTLGRPWGSGTPVAVFIDTKMNVVPSAIGWSEMSGGWPARFAEYNSMTSNGSQIDLSGRKTTFGDGHENNPVLTAEEAADKSDMSAMYGEWDPTEATEQVTAPTNVVLTGSTLTWDDNQYALLYAICKNGNVTAFTTDATYDVDDASATWTIRAANAMGGLSEQSEEAIVAPNTVTIQMNGAGIMTYASVYNLDFAGSGLTAYVCEGSEIVSDTELKLTMTAKDSAPAGTGLMLKGEKSASFTVSTTATPAEITVNKIVGVTEPTNITPEENGGQIINFILANGKYGVDWYTLSEAGTIAANRAYLQLDRSEVYNQTTGSARTVKMAFDDVIDTGIDNIQIDNSLLDDSKPMYNVAGQRVSRSYKGIVIQNGKKVIK